MAIEQVNGVRVNYNQRDFHTGPGKPNTLGATKELVVDFSFDSLPAAGAVGDAVIPELPAGAVVKSSILVVGDAWLSGTSLAIGTKKAADGTELDDDGFNAAILTAALTAGSVHVGAGAQILASLSEAGKVAATVAGSFTAGTARLVVEYIEV